MKKLSLLIIMTFLLFSCNKDNITQNGSFRNVTINSQLEKSSKKDTVYNSVTISGVSTFNDLLWFESLEAFFNAEELLNEFQDDDITTFNEIYADFTVEEFESMTEVEQDLKVEELDSIERAISFSEEGIYAEFENQLNFYSLRKKIEEDENIFLNNPNPNWNNNPDNHYIITSGLRTLFNPYAEVRIASSLFILLEEGYLEVTDANYETLLELRANPNSYESYSNVVLHKTNNPDNCKTNKKNDGYMYSGSNRMYWSIHHRNILGFKKVLAKTVSYKKKVIWRKRKASIALIVDADLCNNSGFYENATPSTIRKKASISKRVYANVDNGKIYSYHQLAGCCNKTNYLTW